MLVTTIWTRRWSPVLCLIFYFTTVSWLVPWNTSLANPTAAANISPDIKAVDGDLSNDELHKLLSLLAGTDTKENPPLSILLAKPPTTVQTPRTTTPSTTIATTTKTTTTTTPAPKTTTTARYTRRFTRATTAHTTSTTTSTEKTQEFVVPATASSEPKQNLRALVSPPQNDLVQQLSLLNSLLGSVGGGNGNANQGLGLGGLGALGGLGGFGGLGGLGGLGALGAPQNGFDASAASEAAAALFGVAPAALSIPTTTTTTTTTTTPRPTTTTIKPVGTLDDTSAALQSLALLNVLLGNAGDTKSANNSAAAALLGLGTASSSPAVRQTQTSSSAQKEQEAAVQLTNLLLQSANAGNPQLQNFKNAPTNNMDTAASNQLSGLLGILGTLGTLNGQQQQPQQQLSQGLFNLGQQNQQPQGNFLSNIFQQQQPQQQPQQTNLLTSLFGGVTTTPAPSIPGFGLLSSMIGLGSTLVSTVTNTLGGSRGDGRPRVRGVDTRLGLGYRFGDNADAQVMWEIGPQIFTQPLKGDESNSIPSKRNAGSTSLLESASTRVLEMFQPNYGQNKHHNPPWRRVDTTEDTVVSKESLSSVAASLPHQSLKTLKALLEMKKRQDKTTPATTPASQKLSSLFSWYSSTTPTPIRKIYLPAQEVFAPPAPSVATSKIGSLFSWFSKATTTAAPIHIPSTQVTPPVSTLDKIVSWYMGGETTLPSTTEQPPLDISSIFFPPEVPKPIPDMWNIEPNNFLKRSSVMPPPSPTSQNYYAKPHINPRNNKHSSLTTYEKYLLGLLEEDEINKSQDIDTVPTISSKNMNHGLNYNNNRRSHSLPHNSNMRDANVSPGWGHQATQQRRNSVNAMNSQKKNPFSQANLNGPYFRQNGNHAKQNRNKQANGNHALHNQNNGNHAVHNQNSGNHAMHNQNNGNHAMHNQNNGNHAMHNQNNGNHAMHNQNNGNHAKNNQNRQAGNHFHFASHNKIVTMTGANSPPPPPPRMRRPPGYMRRQSIVNSGIRRQFGPNRQFSNRQAGSFFNNFNPFAAFSRFTSKKKNNPPNNWNSNNNGNNNNFQNNGNNFQNDGNNNYQNNGNNNYQNTGNNNYQNNGNNNNNFQSSGNNDHNIQSNGNNDHNFQNNGNQNDYNSHNKNRDNLNDQSRSDTYVNLDHTGYGSTGMSNIDTVDSYNPYGNTYGNSNSYGTSGKSHSNSNNNDNMHNNNNHNNDKHQDLNTAASNIHSTKTPYYNPHQNFIPESDDSFDRRNAVVTNPKLRAAELEKMLGEHKEKNDTKAELGRNDRISDDEDDIPDTPTQKLMGLLKTVLNTKIKPRLHNKEKNIASISLTTPKPMLPRNKRPPGARTQTKLKLTNGRPEIVLVPTPPREMEPIVHVGQDMSFEEIQEHYSIKEPKTTTTRKPKVKSKKNNNAKKGNSNKNTELIVSDDDIELSEEDEDSKEVFIDIDSGEVSVLKPVASLTSFEPEKEESPEEEVEEEVIQDEETKRKQEIFEGIQKELHSSFEKMRKAQLKADAKQKRKEELAAKGMDESLDMVSKYFDLIEESEKQDEEKSRPQSPPPHSNAHYANNGRGNPNHRRPTGYNSNNSYSKLRKHKKRRRRDILNNNVEKFSKSPSYFESLVIKKTPYIGK